MAEYLVGIQLAANMSAEAMAEHFGVQTDTLQRVIDGNIPSAPLQMVLKEGLELSVDDFDALLAQTKAMDLREFVIRSVVDIVRTNRPEYEEAKLLHRALTAVGVDRFRV